MWGSEQHQSALRRSRIEWGRTVTQNSLDQRAENRPQHLVLLVSISSYALHYHNSPISLSESIFQL